MRVVTYNVLSPELCSGSYYPHCPPEAVVEPARWAKVRSRVEGLLATNAVIGLQEVDLCWAGRFHSLFAERGYVAVFAQYGSPSSGYMGVMLAWPRDSYEVLDVDISRVSDTAPKGMWPKGGSEAGALLSPFGIHTRQGLQEVLGCSPPEFKRVRAEEQEPNFEWNSARKRTNEAVFARLRPRAGCRRPFCVGTYHMPCLFGPPEKVRVMNIHAFLLLKRLREFAGQDPVVLMGDFNIKPDDSPYHLILSGGSVAAAAATGSPAAPAEFLGLAARLPGAAPFERGLASAYRAFHGREPFVETLDYIWFSPEGLAVVACPPLPATRAEAAGPFPSREEPSDHLPLAATLRLRPLAAA